jgi:hypothetical protein
VVDYLFVGHMKEGVPKRGSRVNGREAEELDLHRTRGHQVAKAAAQPFQLPGSVHDAVAHLVADVHSVPVLR